MREAAVAIARKLKLTGFFGLDFILQDDGDRAWVLELNSRARPRSRIFRWARAETSWPR